MREKKETKKVSNKGITLIALVITIIVLLILAAVSIATLTGDNGILTKASTAKQRTQVEEEREEVKLAYGAAVTEKLSKGDTTNVTADELNTELSNQNIQATATEGTTEEGAIDVTFSETEHKYTVHQSGDEKGKITGPEEGEVPDPPKEQPKTVKEAKIGGDTFSSKTTIKDDKEKPIPVPGGFKIAEDSATVVEEGVVIEDTREGIQGSQFVWIPVTDDSQYVRNKTYVVKEISETAKDDENYLPDDLEKKLTEGKTEGDIEKETVIEAGGFYIGRYEAGKGTADTLVSKNDAAVWINIPQEECKEKSKTFINNSDVKSGLLTGIQWDVVMQFVDTKQDGTGKPFNVNDYTESRHISGEARSGQNKSDKVCNIYDLEGNYYEYVAEQSDCDTSIPYVGRGGGSDSNNYPASYRDVCNGTAYGDHSFRLVLYVI